MMPSHALNIEGRSASGAAARRAPHLFVEGLHAYPHQPVHVLGTMMDNDQLRHYSNKLAYEIDSWDLKVALENGENVIVMRVSRILCKRGLG